VTQLFVLGALCAVGGAAAMAMFQAPVRPAGTVHAEFKAGRSEWDGKTIKSQKTKGKIMLYTSEEDSLMHFQWQNRETNEVTVDLILFNDAYLEKITKCKDGRVYIMKMLSSTKKHFFWMQESKEDGDAELIKKFNEAVGAKIPEKGAATPAAAGAVASAAAADPNVDPAMRAVLEQFLAQQQGAGGAMAGRTPPVPLPTVLTSEALLSLMNDEEAVKEMLPLLPPGQQTAHDLQEALRSPQMVGSMSSLTQAIHSDQLPILFASLGLDSSMIATAAPGSDALEVLCKAMEAKESRGK